MPWLPEAKKDVTSCDKPRGGANIPRSADFRMGQPGTGDRAACALAQGPTRGTETSHYPEEKKTKVIPQVVASERGGAQTATVSCRRGVVGTAAEAARRHSGSAWKGAPERVTAPYAKCLPGGEAVT